MSGGSIDVAGAVSLVEILTERAASTGFARGYRFLDDSGSEVENLSYRELDRRARALAARLGPEARGERALLLYPPGLDFIAAFFGCLYAGTVAVPAYPPRKRGGAHLDAILRDAAPRLVLTVERLLSRVEDSLEAGVGAGSVRLLATDDGAGPSAEAWRDPGMQPDDLAFLQYTSGSTTEPKGVRVTHENLLHNEEMIRRAFGMEDGDLVASWLPLYHDMGLIGGVLQPLFTGSGCILMSPVSFLRRPALWLEMIARYGATVSGGPNFAYELCVERVREEDRRGLDLRSWKVAFNGSEPVRASTLDRFVEAFAPCNFDPHALYSCYGLAEATLFVTGRGRGAGAEPRSFDAADIEAHRLTPRLSGAGARRIVGFGKAWLGQEVAVVDAVGRRRLRDGRVGEVWIAGRSVAAGYWNRPERSAEAFSARLVDEPEAGPYLRTGDLGAIRHGELFLTGRAKDLLLVRGRNVYPHDLEATSEAAHPIFRRGCAAAFELPGDRESKVVLVQEVERRQEKAQEALREALVEVRKAVYEEHEVVPRVVLVGAGEVPRTSSGKVRRSACRDAFTSNRLRTLVDSAATRPLESGEESPRCDAEALRNPVEEVLADLWREILGVDEVYRQSDFLALGGHSVAAGRLVAGVREVLDADIELRQIFETPILGDLARAIESAGEAERTTPLEPATQDAGAPLAAAQRLLWLFEQLQPGTAVYHLPLSVALVGPTRTHLLEQSGGEVERRQAVLRTSFSMEAGVLTQRPLPHRHRPLPVVDLSELAGEAANAEEARLTDGLVARSFDLSAGRPVRSTLLRIAPERHRWLMVVHHLVADGPSLDVFLHEARMLAEAFGRGAPSPFAEPVVQYTDFAHWQARLAGEEGLETSRAAWRERLEGAPVLDLPTDRPRPAVPGFHGRRVGLRLGRREERRLSEGARALGATPFVLFTAASAVLLGRLSGQGELVLGVPVAQRDRVELEGLIGLFAAVLPLRVDLWEARLAEVVAAVREGVLFAHRHGSLAYESTVRERTGEAGPLLRVTSAFQDVPRSRRWGGAEATPRLVETSTAKFDLSFFVERSPEGGGELVLEHDAELFDATTAERWLGCWERLLGAVVETPQARWDRVRIVSRAELHQVLVEANDSVMELGGFVPVTAQVASRVAAAPESVAVVDGVSVLTYGELWRWAARLAEALREQGAGPGSPVGVLLGRSAQRVVACLGASLAGAAYVPMDPAYPAARQRAMLRLSGAPVVVARRRRVDPEVAAVVRVLEVDASARAAGADPPASGRRVPPVEPESLAYVVFTSGSTGTPKGVEASHGGLSHLVGWHRRVYGGDAGGERTTLLAGLGFDASVWETWPTLASGGSLHVMADEVLSDPQALLARLAAERIGESFLPTPLAEEVLAAPVADGLVLRRVLTGGDRLHRRPDPELGPVLINHYGPSEASVVASASTVGSGPGPVPPIGRPIDRVILHVLDRRGRPVPLGVAGELWVGGSGLARGYCASPAETAERFLPDPFGGSGQRLYRTGDLVRRRPDLELEFLGRLDHQVKVRGFRIELGEIESVLLDHPAVAQAAVVVRRSLVGARLVAYAAPGPGAEVTAEHLLVHARRRLPDYMVPSAVELLPRLPLTANGKVDQRALPEPSDGGAGAGYVAPRSSLEEELVRLWSELLGVERVGVHDDFFDLGGHSLVISRMLGRIEEMFGVRVAPRHILERPTVEALSFAIAQTLLERSTAADPIPAAPFEREDLPRGTDP